MKRLFVLPMIIIIMLCGCSHHKSVNPIVNNIIFKAQIYYDDIEYLCNVESSDDCLNFVITAPQEVKDYTLKICKTTVEAKYKDVETTWDISSLSNNAIVLVLCDIFEDVSVKTCCYNDGNCIVSSNITEYEYEFIFSPTGLPLSLEVKDLKFKMFFNNVIVK